mmetsp:Transcript_14284/g.23085  ORF Transcript_14284/g.23085 Transcript_14284/m.23085 type:complete len:313 (-) Transcript_14284:414-1352(-)
MRLYDQRSGTPMSSSSLDGKKWRRPAEFLPRPDQVTSLLQDRTKTEQKNMGVLSNPPGKTKSTMFEERRMRDTNFLFDIDEVEELSMNSSSTLSTHTTLHQQDKQEPCRLGLAKPFPGYESYEKGASSVKIEENPFHVLHSISSQPIKNGLRSIPDTIPDETPRNRQKTTKNSADDAAFATPELTLTDSSEDSDWHEFSSGFDSRNPFRAGDSKTVSTRAKQALCLYPVTKKTPPSLEGPKASGSPNPRSSPMPSPSKHMASGYFSKYSAMLIRGSSVAEVSKVMAQDHVDPSIISLVMLAAANESPSSRSA